MLKDFREFAMRGNVVDMAVGIIIGGAFGTIVKSLVEDVIMPPIGKLTGGIDFKDLKIPLGKSPDGTKDVALSYGNFINNMISFLIVAMAVFMLVKAMNTLKKKEEVKAAPAPEPSAEVKLLTQIRDSLARK
jgi:large conductance mechanosensitive channel